jgi:hypothetical protein
MHRLRFHWRGVAQPGSALGLGPRGRRFESSRPDQHVRETWPTVQTLSTGPTFPPLALAKKAGNLRFFADFIDGLWYILQAVFQFC